MPEKTTKLNEHKVLQIFDKILAKLNDSQATQRIITFLYMKYVGPINTTQYIPYPVPQAEPLKYPDYPQNPDPFPFIPNPYKPSPWRDPIFPYRSPFTW